MLTYLHFDVFELQERKVPVGLINATNERRLVQGHEAPLRVKGDIEDVSTELDNGDCDFVQEESDPVDDETDEGEDNNNNESSKGPSNADAFSVLEKAIEWYERQSECFPTQLLLLKRIRDLEAEKRSPFPTCEDFQYSSSVRFHMLHGSHSVFGYPKNRVSEWCSFPIDSDKRRSTV
ncbi:uncharacterized protein TNCV_799791 [Trichonephila clavipes]|nr:uncharacterized protein TNCV_799791 [Trichonephila clavipes]